MNSGQPVGHISKRDCDRWLANLLWEVIYFQGTENQTMRLSNQGN